MKRIAAVWIAALGLGAAALEAQETYTFIAYVAGGVGGSFDNEGASDFGRDALAAGFGMYTDERTLTVVRVGRLSLDDGLAETGLLDAELEFATVAGEYRFRQAAYDLGVSLGLGVYRRDATRGGVRDEETELGVVVGLAGDFDLTRRLSLLAAVDVHYALFGETRLYGAALVGVAIHF